MEDDEEGSNYEGQETVNDNNTDEVVLVIEPVD